MAAKTTVWKRKYPFTNDIRDNQLFIQENSFRERFSALWANIQLDLYSKRIALKAAPCVVSLKVFSGNEEVTWGSGFILECNPIADNQFEVIVITSTTLLRTGPTSTTLLNDLKVVVVLLGDKHFHGELEAHDFHYNLAAIKFLVDHPLEIARLRCVDDTPSKIESFQLLPHSDVFRLTPGTSIIALGRYHDGGSSIMIAPGVFSIEQCRFDCKELLRSTCRITKCGIGGPVVNKNGEVIGVSFFELKFTPFLPINLVSRWWNHYKKYRDYRRPWLGVELSNLYTVEVSILERIIQKFPSVRKGIMVDEVIPNSPASSAGLLANDIIIECDGKVVDSALQFFCDLTWEKVGKSMNLAVIRNTGESRLAISVTVADSGDNRFNSWPLP